MWRTPLSPSVLHGTRAAHPALAERAADGGVVLFQLDVGRLYALRTDNGSVVWSAELSNSTRGAPRRRLPGAADGPASPFAPLLFARSVLGGGASNASVVATAFDADVALRRVRDGHPLWHTDLCALPPPARGECWLATAGPTLLRNGSAPVLGVPVRESNGSQKVAVLGLHAANGTLAFRTLLRGLRGAPLRAPLMGVGSLAAVFVDAPAALLVLDVARDGRVLWNASTLVPPQRFGGALRKGSLAAALAADAHRNASAKSGGGTGDGDVSAAATAAAAALGASLALACEFRECGVSLQRAPGVLDFQSDELTCLGAEAPYACTPEAATLRAGDALLIAVGVATRSHGALVAIEQRGSHGDLLWRYDGVDGAAALERLRTPIVGHDGMVFVNDARGSLHAIRVLNRSTPAPTTYAPSTSNTELPPHHLAPPHAPAPSQKEPFSGVLLVLIVVGSSLGLFGLATTCALCIVRWRGGKRLEYDTI